MRPAAILLLAVPILHAVVPRAIAAAPQIKPATTLQHAAVDIGQTSKFTVTATGEALSYQWRLDGHDVPGQTNQTLTFAPAQPSDEGDYTVEVRNAEGWVLSEPARLWVVPPAVDFVKDNYTNNAGRRLPYFYLLPANYDPARSYPLMCLLHGAPCDETSITTPNYGRKFEVVGGSRWLQTALPFSIPQKRYGESCAVCRIKLWGNALGKLHQALESGIFQRFL